MYPYKIRANIVIFLFYCLHCMSDFFDNVDIKDDKSRITKEFQSHLFADQLLPFSLFYMAGKIPTQRSRPGYQISAAELKVLTFLVSAKGTTVCTIGYL